jgi:hypothetical protein
MSLVQKRTGSPIQKEAIMKDLMMMMNLCLKMADTPSFVHFIHS